MKKIKHIGKNTHVFVLTRQHMCLMWLSSSWNQKTNKHKKFKNTS